MLIQSIPAAGIAPHFTHPAGDSGVSLELTMYPQLQRLGQVLRPLRATGRLLVAGSAGERQLWDLTAPVPELARADYVGRGHDGRVRVYRASVDGQLPAEALDMQLLTDALVGVRLRPLPAGGAAGSLGEQFAVAYREQALARAAYLQFAGVLTLTDGRLALTADWQQRYVLERMSAAASPLPRAPAAAEYVGVVREIGALNPHGRRALVLDTPAGSAVVASQFSRAAIGQSVRLRADGTVHELSAADAARTQRAVASVLATRLH